jgi:hypothetical protein
LNGFGAIKGGIKCKTVNMSKIGAELRIDKIFPYKKGDNLRIYDMNLQKYSQAQVRWAKRDFNNNVTNVGLKVTPNLNF